MITIPYLVSWRKKKANSIEMVGMAQHNTIDIQVDNSNFDNLAARRYGMIIAELERINHLEKDEYCIISVNKL